jgi:hypothetical protein
VQARLERFEWLANVRDVLPRGQVWPPKNLYDLGFPKQLDPPAVAIGDYFYPTNASRWSIFRGYMTRDDVDAVKAEVWPTSSQTPTTGTFLIQSEGGDSEGEVETELYMLPPIPVAGLTASDPQIFLVTLVDERYFWHQFKEAGVVTCTSATATWSDLIDQLATQLDIDLTYETPDSDYGSPEPDSALYSNQESPAILLDAAAANIGCVVVRALDGTYSLQRYADAIDATETNRPDSDNNVLGGRAASKSDSTSGDVAYRGLLPASVTVSFPKWVDGAGYYEPTTYRDHVKASYGATYTKTVTLEDAGFSGYAHHDGSKMLRTSAKARYTVSSDPSPNNQTTCDALAAQLAADYFATRLAWLDEVYAGIYPWTPEGVSDLLYSWRDGSVYTRILPPPFNVEINDFQHGFGPLAIPDSGPSLSVVTNDCPTFGDLAFATTDGNVTDVLLNGVSILGGTTSIVVGQTVERRVITFPAGTTIGGAICTTDPTDCCGGTVETDCCPDNDLPTTLYLTFADTGTCPKFDGQTFPLTYSVAPCAGTGSWISEEFTWDCHSAPDFPLRFRFWCDGQTLEWSLCIIPTFQCQCDGRFAAFALAEGGACDPFMQTFTSDQSEGSAGCDPPEQCGALSCVVTT